MMLPDIKGNVQMRKLLKGFTKMLFFVFVLMIALFGVILVDYECSRIYGNEGALVHLILEEKNGVWYHNYMSEIFDER